MQIDQQLLMILAAVCSVLLLASVASIMLRRRFAVAGPNAAFDNVDHRIHAWWGMVWILGGAVLVGRVALIALFAAISFLALREFLTLTTVGASDRRALLAAFLMILPMQYVLAGTARFGMFALLIPVFAGVVLPILSAMSGETHGYLARAAELFWSVMVCIYCISYVPALYMLRLPGVRHDLLVVYLVVVIEASDVFQYCWGKLLGRHRIAPALSPAKTVEGFVGGILSATVLGALLRWMTPFSVGQAIAVSFCITVSGFFGGLVMSAIKRDRGKKDWSSLIPGHGGILDRVDSLCFAAPVFFYLTRWLVA